MKINGKEIIENHLNYLLDDEITHIYDHQLVELDFNQEIELPYDDSLEDLGAMGTAIEFWTEKWEYYWEDLIMLSKDYVYFCGEDGNGLEGYAKFPKDKLKLILGEKQWK